MNKSIKNWGKVLMIACLGIGLMTFSSCKKDDPVNPTPDPVNPTPNPNPTPGPSNSGDSWANLINETPHEAIVNGNTLTYGDHTYTVSGEDLYQHSFGCHRVQGRL